MKKQSIEPTLWACALFIFAVAVSLIVASQVKISIDSGTLIPPPPTSVQYPIIYFFGAVLVLGVVLFFIPVKFLKYVFRVMFFILFGWGIFVLLLLFVPEAYIAALIAVAAGIVWFISPRVWLHDLLLALALSSIGVVFGLALKPWGVLIVLGAISIYDIVAVRFGFMMWMVQKMSEVDTLPAFIIPRKLPLWGWNLRGGKFSKLFSSEAGEREFSLLGGGDIGFPLVMTGSVFYGYGLSNALVVAGFAMLGLIGAFVIQQTFLKGKPMPALPPISLGCLIGFVIVWYVIG